MKIKLTHTPILTACAAVALVVSGNITRAADNIIVGPTATESGLQNNDCDWQNMWGPAWRSLTYDAGNPPPNGALGGTYVQNDWTGDTGGMDSYNIASPGNWWGAVTFDAAQYQSIEFDFKWDLTNSFSPTNNAHMEFGLDSGYAFTSLTNISLNTNSSPLTDGLWHHISVKIPSTIAGAGSAHSPSWYSWNPAGSTGTMNFWLANFQIIARIVPVLPPTVALTKPIPGLTQFMDTGPTYDRDNVRSVDSANVSWYGRTKPVTYSFTVADFPGASRAGFYMNLNICPDPIPQNFSDPDWTGTNNLFISMVEQGDGTVIAGAYYKTNQPSGNGMYNPGDTAAGKMGLRITNATAVGTWTLTFTSDTAATLTAPGGASSSLSLPADVAALFNTPCIFYVGCAMGGNNAGASLTLSHIALTGTSTTVANDLTTGTLDPNLQLVSQHYNEGGPWTTSPVNQKFVTANDVYWFHWNLPDNGYSPLSLTALTGGVVTDLGTNIFLNGPEHWMKIAKTDLPGANQGYFRLLQRQFSQLQILFPGETNAPNTVTGKVGTPFPISSSVNSGLVNVTINACDSTWHIVNASGDNINLTTTGSGIMPNDAALISGTLTTVIQFPVQDTETITAADTTNVGITSASETVTVVP